MELKKDPKVDLARQSPLFMNIGLIVALGLCLLAFEWKTYDDLSEVSYAPAEVQTEELIDIPITEMPPPPPPVIQQPEIVEVPDEEEIEEELVNLDTEITQETVVAPPAPPVEAAPAPVEEVEEIFQVVENQPEPVGGMGAFMQYLQKNLKYPEQARRMNVEGKVFVQFVIDKDGSPTDITVLKGIGSGCDEEAIRVIKNMPKWTPGKQRGRPVKVRMSLPIVFKLG